jgi:molybdopterin-guanine dinucleotide biosynthesis protein B
MAAISETRVIGFAGWSGAGKTTLITRLIPLLIGRGLKVAALKHAHHSFEVDRPGKDSYEFRAAGAAEVIVVSSRRWAQMHELTGETEPTLGALIQRVSPCDLVLIEGFKEQSHPKIEVYRRELGLAPLHPGDPRIVAIATDSAFPEARVPVVDLNDLPAIAALVTTGAEPLGAVVAGLAPSSP